MDIFLNAAQQIPEYKKLDKYLDDHNTLPALVTGVSHIHKAHICLLYTSDAADD